MTISAPLQALYPQRQTMQVMHPRPVAVGHSRCIVKLSDMPLRNSASLTLLAAIGLTALIARAANLTPSSISVASSANPSLLGQSVSLTATVSPRTATGSVTFYDGTTVLGIRTLANGQAIFSTTLLVSGPRPARAYYAGSASNAASSSAVLTQKVNTVPINGFAPAVTNPPYVDSVSIAIGDFNGDGKADLATANYDVNTVSVRLGNGDGTFQPPVSYAIQTASGSHSIAVGDFNGDGIADLVVACWGIVEVFLGNGNGTFQPAVGYPAGLTTESVAVGDFNGDGIEDLAVANRDDGTVSVFLGTVTGPSSRG